MEHLHVQSSELDLKYHLHEDENQEDSISTENGVEKHFKWLNKLISYSPTWATKTISGKSKNKCLTIVMMLSIVVWICGNMFGLSIFQILVLSDLDIIERIIIPMTRTLFDVSRIMGVYYFYFHFNYPWHHNVSGFICHSQIEVGLFCKKNVWFIKITVFVLGFVSFVLRICEIVSICYNFGYRYWESPVNVLIYIPLLALFFYFRDIPLLALLSVQAAIFIKYASYLSQVTTLISSDNNSMQDMISQYRMLYKAFKKDHHPILDYAIHVYLLFIIMQSWFIVYEVIQVNTYYHEMENNMLSLVISSVDSAWILWPCIIYAASSIVLNETFEKFSAAIWKLGDGNLKNKSRIDYDLLCLISYTQKYRISSKVGSLIVTKKNVINIVIVFVFARSISYSMRYFE